MGRHFQINRGTIMSYYDEKGSSRDTGRVDRRAPHTSPESMIEDEEDYQEFVRSMNRKRGRTEDSHFPCKHRREPVAPLVARYTIYNFSNWHLG